MGTTTFRAELRHYLDLVADGVEVVITDRGVPVARVTPVGSATILDELIRAGLIAPAARPARQRATGVGRAKAKAPVSDLVSELRG